MLPPIVGGREKACFAVTEPNTGLNTTQLKTRAERRGDVYVVNGQKVWISTAQVAEKVLLLARNHAARRGQKARPTVSVFFIRISTANVFRSMRSKKWVERRSTPTNCFSRISKFRPKIVSRRRARLRIYPARHESRADPDRRRSRRTRQAGARSCSGLCARADRFQFARSARTKRFSILLRRTGWSSRRRG